MKSISWIQRIWPFFAGLLDLVAFSLLLIPPFILIIIVIKINVARFISSVEEIIITKELMNLATFILIINLFNTATSR